MPDESIEYPSELARQALTKENPGKLVERLRQWGVKAHHIEKAWNIGVGSTQVVLGVLLGTAVAREIGPAGYALGAPLVGIGLGMINQGMGITEGEVKNSLQKRVKRGVNRKKI